MNTHLALGLTWRGFAACCGWIRGVLIFAAVLAFSLSSCADNLDETITVWMMKRNIPGLSLAIIENGVIVKARGYGVVEQFRTANLNDAWYSAKFLEAMMPHLPQMARDLAAFGALKSIVRQS